jgi:hypothetical protein
MRHVVNRTGLVAKCSLVVLAIFGFGCPAAEAVEGGTGAYLLSSRDLLAGFVPPPGTYILNDFIYINGSAPVLSIGGAIVTEPDIDAMVYKFSGTQVFEGEFLGGRFGMNVNIPLAKADLKADTLFQNSPIRVSDDQFGMGDITITPMIGWDSGNLHASASVSFFIPTGQYSTAVVKPLQGVYDVLSIGKNKFAVDPALSMTYLDPTTGFEFSGSLGITINAENTATDYLTAPELHLELTAAQHLPTGFVFGVTGYGYQQLGNDSGKGAENFQKAVGAKSLQARVFGAGPVVQYNSKIGSVPVSVEGKFIQEFGTRRRLESQMFWMTLGASF